MASTRSKTTTLVVACRRKAGKARLFCRGSDSLSQRSGRDGGGTPVSRALATNTKLRRFCGVYGNESAGILAQPRHQASGGVRLVMNCRERPPVKRREELNSHDGHLR